MKQFLSLSVSAHPVGCTPKSEWLLISTSASFARSQPPSAAVRRLSGDSGVTDIF
jgi:hypothetical protein